MLENIQREFELNNPKLVYIDHEMVGSKYVGVGFLFISDQGKVYGGVRTYPIENGQVLWKADIHTFNSWKDVNVNIVRSFDTRSR